MASQPNGSTTPEQAKRLTRSLVALLAPIVALVIHFVFRSFFGPAIWFLFYPAVFVSSWVTGLEGAVLATAFSTLSVLWFAPPLHTLAASPGQYVAAALFSATGILFGVFHDRFHKATQRITHALRASEVANARLQQARDTVAAIIEHAPDGIFVTDVAAPNERRLTGVNDAGCRMLGYTREEILGRRLIDLIHPEQLGRIEQTRTEILEGQHHVAEWRLQRKDASYVPVEVSAGMLPDGRWQGFVRDISTRKAVEREHALLAEVGAVFASTLDYGSVLQAIADVAVRDLADLCIIAAIGDNALRNEKVAARDPSLAPLCDLITEIRVDRSQPYLTRAVIETGRPVLIEHLSRDAIDAAVQSEEHRRALRALEHRSVIAVPLTVHNKVLGMVILCSSIASAPYSRPDLHLAEELALRAALALENARLYRIAKEATQARDEVLGIVAHDLRNPLGNILMGSTLLQRSEGQPDAPSTREAQAIHRAAERMDRLIHDLIDVTRLEAGHLSIEPSRVPAADLVSESVEAQRALAASRSIEVESDLAPELPAVWGDRDRLLQVLQNLIDNAITYTIPGNRVTVGAAPRDDDVLFWVADTGPGISAADLSHVFDRFWHAGRSQHSVGLGLAIAKGIVDAHGGHIWAESTPGRGSTFFFEIPTEAIRQSASR